MSRATLCWSRSRSHQGLVQRFGRAVILDTGDLDVVATRITTQSASSPFDVALADWRGAGLLAPSSLRLHKLATLAKADIQRKLGRLQATDRQTVTAGLRRIVDAW